MAIEQGFRRLQISDWRQFTTVELDLANQLTILTGENGTGKTTLLSILSAHFGFNTTFVATPTRFGNNFRFVAGRRRNQQPSADFEEIGLLTYYSGTASPVGIWEYGSAEFNVGFSNQQPVNGISLNSHRIVPSYGVVQNLPAKFKSASEIMAEYKQQLMSWWQPWVEKKPPSLLMKEALVAAAMFSEGNSAIVADPQAAEVWEGFQRVLSILMPESLGFTKLMIDQAEVIVQTEKGPFALEAASGGASAMFDLAWQIYLQSRESDNFTVCIDEPENHLHPSLQRSILPKLLRAFPNVKFIVATHSPFVVTSSKDARVYVLRSGEEGVFSEVLDLRNQAMTADEVLRDVLGVGTTMPIWAEQEFDKIMELVTGADTSVENVQRVAQALREAGIRLSIPEIADAVVRVEELGDKSP